MQRPGPYHDASGFSHCQEGTAEPRIEYSNALDFLPALVFLSFEMGTALSAAVNPCFRQFGIGVSLQASHTGLQALKIRRSSIQSRPGLGIRRPQPVSTSP
jgi:hypothetical protein